MTQSDSIELVRSYLKVTLQLKIIFISSIVLLTILWLLHMGSLIGWYDFSSGVFTTGPSYLPWALPFVIYIGLGIIWLSMRKLAINNNETFRIIDRLWFKSYFLRLQMRLPVGDTTIDRFISIIQEDDDEIVYLENIKKSEKDVQLDNGVVIDLKINSQQGMIDTSNWFKRNMTTVVTKRSIFIRNFNKSVTLDDISTTVNSVISKYGEKSIFRLVILSKEFDKIFFDDEDISKKIQNVSKSINLDLIQETDNKFLFIWTSLLAE